MNRKLTFQFKIFMQKDIVDTLIDLGKTPQKRVSKTEIKEKWTVLIIYWQEKEFPLI